MTTQQTIKSQYSSSNELQMRFNQEFYPEDDFEEEDSFLYINLSQMRRDRNKGPRAPYPINLFSEKHDDLVHHFENERIEADKIFKKNMEEIQKSIDALRQKIKEEEEAEIQKKLEEDRKLIEEQRKIANLPTMSKARKEKEKANKEQPKKVRKAWPRMRRVHRRKR